MIPFSTNGPLPFSIWVSKLRWHSRTLLISHFHVAIIPLLQLWHTHLGHSERGCYLQGMNLWRHCWGGKYSRCRTATKLLFCWNWVPVTLIQYFTINAFKHQDTRGISSAPSSVYLVAESEDSMTVTSTMYFSVLLSVDKLLLDPT